MDGEMIHICYCCNDRYFPQVLLSVLSLVKHTQEPVTVHIATMTLTEKDPRWTPFTEEQRVIVENVLKEKNPESRAEVIDMTEEYKRRLRGGVNENTSFSPYSMIRLLLDLYDLPDKLIYVDTDAMFCDSANELWKQDVEGHEVGAVYEVWYKMLRPFYFWKPFYCNSGVLLLNLKMIRETGLFERLRDRVRTKKMNFPDQTAIAFLCKTKKELPRRFNEQRKIRKNTVIKHFVGFFQWYGPVFVQRVVKPTEVERVHKVMKIHEFDDVYEKYNRLAAEYGFAAL